MVLAKLTDNIWCGTSPTSYMARCCMLINLVEVLIKTDMRAALLVQQQLTGSAGLSEYKTHFENHITSSDIFPTEVSSKLHLSYDSIADTIEEFTVELSRFSIGLLEVTALLDPSTDQQNNDGRSAGLVR